MTAITADDFPTRSGEDRNAFLIFVALVWVGVLSGFGTDSFNHVSKHGLDYPPIVHVHALVFVGWLTLFTVQTILIRDGRVDLHRRLGVAGAMLAAVMLVLGPATALIVDAARFVSLGRTPEFLAVQLIDILGFAGLVGAGLSLRGKALAHKRLMLMGLIFISDAGFARFLNGFAAAPLGEGFWGEITQLYGGSNLLVLGLGVYDLVTRRRLHPAYVLGVAWIVVLEVIAWSGLHSAPWKALSLRLIGH